MKITAKNRILTVEPYRPGKPIDEVKRELGLKEVVKLASNEMPFGPSPRVSRAIATAVKDLNRYPDGGCFYLRQELAKRLKVAPEEIIFGNGSDEVIVMAIRALVSEGDNVVIADPSFLMYEISAKLEGAEVRQVPQRNFRYDTEAMLGAVDARTRIIFIANPDNPAGTYITSDKLEGLLARVPSNVLVFVDEAYFEFVREKDYPNTLALRRRYPNLLLTRTFSKMYGLAGLRIGYGVAEKELVDILNRVRDPFNINSLAQTAALACLKDHAFYHKRAELIARQRKVIYRGLDKLGVAYVPSAANFILIDLKRESRPVFEGLLKKGVIVRDMASWGLKTSIRVTVGTPAQNKKFLTALKAVLKA